MHLRAIGCGWTPKLTQVNHLDQQDLHNDPTKYSCCSFCFRNHTWPSSWTYRAPHDSDNGESSDSTESQFETDSAVDTASEQEAVTILPINHSNRPTSGLGKTTDD